MKLKWINGLLALLLVLTMVPVPVQAAGGAARVGNTTFATLPEAVAAAGQQPVELLQDVTLTQTLLLPDGLVLDGSNFTIRAAGPIRQEPLLRLQGRAELRNVTLDSDLRATGLEAGVHTALTLQTVSLLNSRGNGVTLRGASLDATALTVAGSAAQTAIDAGPQGKTKVSVHLRGTDHRLEELFPVAADNWTDNKTLVQVQSEDPDYQYDYNLPPVPNQISFLLPELLAGTPYESKIKVIMFIVNKLEDFPAVTVNGKRVDRHVWSRASTVTFQINGGTWAKDTQTEAKMPMLNGRGTLVSLMVPKGMKPNGTSMVGAWEQEPEIRPLFLTGDTTYTYTFKKETASGPVARIGTTDYASAAEAVKAAKPGDTVTLLRDAAVTAVLHLPQQVQLDGQGHRLYVQDGVLWTTDKTNNAGFLMTLAQNCSLRNVTLDSMRLAGGVLALADGITLTDVTLLHSKGVGLTVRSAAVEAEDLTVSGSGAYASVDVTPAVDDAGNTIGTSKFTLTGGQLLDPSPISAGNWEQNSQRVVVEAPDYPFRQHTPPMPVVVQLPKIPNVPKTAQTDLGNKSLWTKSVSVTFRVENGSFADGSTVQTVELPLICGKATLPVTKIPAMTPAVQGTDGSWEQLPNVTMNGISGPVTYTFRYDRAEPTGDYEVRWEETGAVVLPGKALLEQGGSVIAAVHSAEGRLLAADTAPMGAQVSMPYPAAAGTVTIYFVDQNGAPLADPAVHSLP